MARLNPPSTTAPEIEPDGRQICWRCCTPFWPDSSPNLLLCGPCDLAESEAWSEGSL
jgi:hypothetical protein